MQTSGGPADVPDSREMGGDAVVASVRSAFTALAGGARGQRLFPGSLDGLRLPTAARAAWIGGWGAALAEVPVLVLTVTPSSLSLGDASVVDPADRDVAESFHAAGARALVLFSGVSEDELVLLARLLVTTWPPPGHGELDLESAQWGLDLPHVYLELSGPGEGSTDADLRAPGRLRAEVGDPDARGEAGVQIGTLDPAILAELQAIRDVAAPPEPIALMTHPASIHAVPLDLAAEVAAVRTGADMHPPSISELLLACLDAQKAPERQSLFATAALQYALGLVGGPVSPGPVVHGLLAQLDTDFSPDADRRAAVREAVELLAVEPQRGRLLRVLGDANEDDLRGELFSLFSLVSNEESVQTLAEVLPRWAVRVLGDALLVRDGEGPSTSDRIRARLRATGPGTILLALAMAARTEEARLIDAILPLAEHAESAVREAALFALRKQRSARVRDMARRRLDDPASGVRIEALRYCVAYRDLDAGPWLEARLSSAELAEADEAEVRATCIAAGRLLRESAEALLVELATGRRRPTHPAVPRFALHGLRAIGSSRARAGLEQVITEVPRLRAEAMALLAQEER